MSPNANWIPASPVRRGYVDRPGRIRSQSPERRRRTVRENGASSTGKHRRHELSFPAQIQVPNCIYPLLNAMQTSGCRALVHRSFRQAKGEELVKRGNAVLPLGQAGNALIDLIFPPTG